MTSEGVDYSFSRPNPQALRAAGKTFVLRYLTGPGKALTGPELAALHQAGLLVGLIHEADGNETLGGGPRGDIEGAIANSAADKLGVPHDVPIYYTVDYDDRGHPGCLPRIAQYLAAAESSGRRDARAYGSVRVIDYLAKPGFQTAAWSGTAISPHAVLYQHAFQVNVAGGATDLVRALTADFGQFPRPVPEDDMPLTPDEWAKLGVLIRAETEAAIQHQFGGYINGKWVDAAALQQYRKDHGLSQA